MFLERSNKNQSFFAPEVVQTSAMDCGPAALKSILEGFGIPVSYGRLREACQTDVDGTSINTIEDIAIQLGMQAEQVMLPVDHLVLPEAQALPAIVVVQRPSGLTHFLVVWSRLGNFLQVMDPATGRRWPTWRRFINELYVHTFPVATQDWRSWAGSDGLLAPLRRRMLDLELTQSLIDELVDRATQDLGWRSLATLDAATRMTAAIVRGKGLPAGEQAGRVLERFFTLNLEGSLPQKDPSITPNGENKTYQPGLTIPTAYWSVIPAIAPGEGTNFEAQAEHLMLQGAVLVRILGRREDFGTQEEQPLVEVLSPDLEAALIEPAYRPEREVWKALREDGLLTPVMVSLALFLSTVAVLIEALLFQGLIVILQGLSQVSQRILAMMAILAFVVAAFLIEFPINAAISKMGRRLETRLRIAYLEKLPRLGDRYFRSRLASDMTQRAHDLRQLRVVPGLGFGILRTGFQLILTMIGVIWLDPISAPLAIVGTTFFVGLSFITRPFLEERDLRMRTHTGALSRFYLDTLLGLVPIKTHGAERAVRRQHEMQLFEWVRTGREYNSMATLVQSLGVLLYSIFSILIVVNYLLKGGDPGEILLLFYWTLSLPALGQALAGQIQQYPLLRNSMLRLLEPLGAPDEEHSWAKQSLKDDSFQEITHPNHNALSVNMEGVVLHAGGHVILEGINLKIGAGEHLAIVGLSGAGKSSLVGLLLGWHRPTRGQIKVDNQILDGQRLASIRRQIAWVDPAVQLWNRSLYDNLRYGIEHSDGNPFNDAIRKSDLYDVMERLPEGMKTVLGEGGGLVSGGEGQRVRLGRALLRPDVRLAILDEPFRGLDREQRRQLLIEARKHWHNTTLICVTHDVGETLNFPRVLVIENGRIIEDGSPSQLTAKSVSRYRGLLEAEGTIRESLWEKIGWRKFNISAGILNEIKNNGSKEKSSEISDP